MPALPRPDVTVTTGEENGRQVVDVKVERDGKARSYQDAGETHAEATKRVIEKILKDPTTAEWLP